MSSSPSSTSLLSDGRGSASLERLERFFWTGFTTSVCVACFGRKEKKSFSFLELRVPNSKDLYSEVLFLLAPSRRVSCFTRGFFLVRFPPLKKLQASEENATFPHCHVLMISLSTKKRSMLFRFFFPIRIQFE